MTAATSVDPQEIEQFTRIAEEWWDPTGKFKPLHDINPLRIGYIREQACAHFNRDTDTIRPLQGIKLLDIGCGGGLISEPISRIGTETTGIDAGEKNISVAKLHAEKTGAQVNYLNTTAEQLVDKKDRFDIVLALEIIEHVTDPYDFIATCAALVAPGGLLIMSTINRTPQAYIKAIVGAEYVLRLLPRGTHQWRKFVKPSEMAAGFRRAGLQQRHATGMILNPLKWQWQLSEHDLSVNYLMTSTRPA